MFPVRKLAPTPDPSADPTLPEELGVEEAELPAEAAADPLEALEQPGAGGVLDQQTVQYMTGDLGPFSCATCAHFLGNTCEVVSGEIDPAGLCRVWTPGYDQMAEPAVEGDVEGLDTAPPTTTDLPPELMQMKG